MDWRVQRRQTARADVRRKRAMNDLVESTTIKGSYEPLTHISAEEDFHAILARRSERGRCANVSCCQKNTTYLDMFCSHNCYARAENVLARFSQTHTDGLFE